MEKIRVYELAKELNTTSKRLMEKLGEINIQVKNHMSLLEDHELESLYKHIGLRHDDDKKHEGEEKKAAPPAQQQRVQQKEAKKDIPRIIRTTEIILDSRNEPRETVVSGWVDPRKKDQKARDRNQKRDYNVRVSDANSGLRAGYERASKPDFPKRSSKTDPGRPQPLQQPKSGQKQEQKTEKTQETKFAAKPEATQEPKPAAPEQSRPVEAANEKKEQKTGAGVGRQPEPKPVQTPAANGAADTEKIKAETRQGTRPQTTNVTPPGNDRGQSQAQRPQHGQRPDRPQQGRAPQQYGRPQGGRPNEGRGPAEQNRRPGDRPPYGRQAGDRPSFNRPAGDRPRGDFSQRPGNRQGGDRRPPQGGQRPGRPLDIPKPELSAAQKEEMLSQRGESRREFSVKDVSRDAKREQKRDIPKTQPQAKGSGKSKFKPVILSEKKGISEALSEDYILEEFYDDTGVKKTRKVAGKRKDGRMVRENRIPPRAVLTSITIPESLTVKELAESLKKTSTEVIKRLMAMGMMATVNQDIDFDTATLVAGEFGVTTEKALVVNEEDILFDDSQEDEGELVPRPPVVVVMGHVDHGKTSLLDAIREANVIDTEAGGITQHIGAYTVKINNRNITFLDTPGHEAFTAMRARGAQVTDIAILVVAADDGVMPQTIEAINHAKAANVSIIVAINKIDKPGANADKVKQELTEHGLVIEEWGGDIIAVPVSAKLRQNIDQLLEMVLLTADIKELKANPNKQAKGTIIEAKLDKNRGPLTTLLVQRGTLNVGDSIVTGTTVGRIRAMFDDKGISIKAAGPSTPVEILGLPEVPEAGEIFYAITDERIARQLAEKRKFKQREQTLKSSARVSLDDLFNQIKEGKVKELNIIVKADVQGSVEAVKQSLEKLSNDEVRVNIIHGGVGAITEQDVTLALVSNAIIIGFNVRPGANVSDAAKDANVDLRLYRVIYNAIEDVQAAMNGMLEPTFKEVVLGHAEIRQIFKVSGIGTIAGCYVTDGKIARNSDVRVVRDGIVVHEGKLGSLKRFKDDAKEVQQGFECGLSIERFNDIKESDVVEAYIIEEVTRN